MKNEFIDLLGMRLDDVIETDVIRRLNETPYSELIVDQFGMSFYLSGIEMTAPLDGRVSSIFFYLKAADDFAPFKGTLPDEISLSDGRSEVRKKLGTPTRSGGNVRDILGHVPEWDFYDRPSYLVNVQYSEDNLSIIMVTIMRPGALDA